MKKPAAVRAGKIVAILSAGFGIGAATTWALRCASIERADQEANVGLSRGWPMTTHAPSGPTIEQVLRLSSLVTTRVDVADVLVTDLEGHTGGVSAILLVKGDCTLGIDLSRAKFESPDSAPRKDVLVLPRPTLLAARVDQEKTRLLAVDARGLWQIVPGDGGRTVAVEEAYARAQGVMAAIASRPELVEKCRHDAEESLHSFFTAAGWTISIRWADE